MNLLLVRASLSVKGEWPSPDSPFMGGMLHGLFESMLTRYNPDLLKVIKGSEHPGELASYAILPPPTASSTPNSSTEHIRFGIALFGDAAGYWPDIASALVQDQHLKLGPPGSYRDLHIQNMLLMHPDQPAAHIYSEDDLGIQWVDGYSAPLLGFSQEQVSEICIDFQTPALIQSSSQRHEILTPFTMLQIVRSLAKRLTVLEPDTATRMQLDSKAWIEAVEQTRRHVAIEKSSARQVSWRYGSARHRPMLLKGLLGPIHYKGLIPAAVNSLLQLGQWMPVGQKPTLGMGWYRLVGCDTPD